jgi:hypothetical protein
MSYLRDPDTGNVYLEADNPQAAYSPADWAVMIAEKESRLAQMQAVLAGGPQPKTAPDQETLEFYNASLSLMAPPGLAEQAAQLQAELAAMKAV